MPNGIYNYNVPNGVYAVACGTGGGGAGNQVFFATNSWEWRSSHFNLFARCHLPQWIVLFWRGLFLSNYYYSAHNGLWYIYVCAMHTTMNKRVIRRNGKCNRSIALLIVIVNVLSGRPLQWWLTLNSYGTAVAYTNGWLEATISNIPPINVWAISVIPVSGKAQEYVLYLLNHT